MNRGAETRARRSNKPRSSGKPKVKPGTSKPLYSRHPIARQTFPKRRVIPPATRPGFRVPSLTKKSVAFAHDAPSGKEVAIAGSFNNWEPEPMTKERDGLWRITLQLAHGTYLYRFLVDGEWFDDQSNPRKTLDSSGISTSVCDVL